MADNFISAQMPDVSHIANALKRLPDDLAQKVLEQSTRREVGVWRKRAQALAPQSFAPHWVGRKGKRFRAQPGHLRKSIRVSKLHKGQGIGMREVKYGIRISQRAYYWRFVELGTAKATAQPFLRPAFDELVEKSFANVANDCAKRIEAYFRTQSGQKFQLQRVTL
jgi:HK97 gp10 family phage protein